ncbi:MAG: sigma-70 family RNA polymerase sigma factor [Defluviitaleaceae bacterium]|nr:sigma-70 family RNA polymerase sigma factor [Defluviitaleaceae bacterium]
MDINVLEQIYKKYYKNIYNYIAFRINNHFDAEELANTVFEKAIASWERYNPAKPAEAWLITIAKNTVTDYLRKQSHRNHAPLEEAEQVATRDRQPDQVVLLDEQNRDLMEAVAGLKPKERQVISLRFATDLSYTEIAHAMGITGAHARLIAHRALKKLRKMLEEVWHEEYVC